MSLRVVIRHTPKLYEFLGKVDDAQRLPSLQMAQDETGALRRVSLASVTDRIVLYVTEPSDVRDTPEPAPLPVHEGYRWRLDRP